MKFSKVDQFGNNGSKLEYCLVSHQRGDKFTANLKTKQIVLLYLMLNKWNHYIHLMNSSWQVISNRWIEKKKSN